MMNPDSAQSLAEQAAMLTGFQKETRDKLQGLESELDRWISEMCAANIALREKLKTRLPPAQKTPSFAIPSVTLPIPSGEDYKLVIEKLLQGSIDTLGDKLSDRILAMLKELKTMAGPMREAKFQEIRDTAASEHVDLAALFLHEKVESNLGQEGIKIEEKKTRGIGSILDKLKKMKGGGPDGNKGAV